MTIEVKKTLSSIGKRLPEILKNFKTTKVGKVGWSATAKYDDEDNTPVAYVASQNEYGNPRKRIPARPFMRPTIIAKENIWKKIIEAECVKIVQGNSTIETTMEIVGVVMAGDIRKAISVLTSPPLSPVTIAKRLERKSNKKTIGALDKPLIDTGVMIGSLSNTVEDE